MKNIYMIGNTHFDPVWLWKWDEAMASIHSTFRSALDRMNEDEEFVYSFSTPPVFEWIKKIDPEMFKEIQLRVKQGRWEICEGWWLQPDCFSACGESYARQALYAQKYNMENFGLYADTVFNVDSFGHNSSIPQILKKSHVNNYCMCRPENYHFEIKYPYFSWKGKDGSEVKTFRIGQYSEIYNKDMEKNINMAEKNMESSACDEMMVFGVTNHGGAPTKKAISEIHRLNKEKDYEIKFGTVSDYFRSQGEPQVNIKTELITKDFGPYTNNHKIKKKNRMAEYTATNCEKAAVIAKHILGIPYPKKRITDCWKDIMFNQFHDILGGACIKDAYDDAYNQLGRAIFTSDEILQFSLQAITKKINTPGKNPETEWNLVVWNMNDADYDGYIEAEVQWLHEFPEYSGGIVVEDESGCQYECQKILEKSVIPGFRSRFVFKATIPAVGYKTFKVIKTGKEAKRIYSQDFGKIETNAFEVYFDENTGYIKSIFAKKLNREYKNIFRPECFVDDGDTWCFNIDSYGDKLEEFKPVGISVIENGSQRTVIKTVHKFRNSLISVYYTFYNEADYFDVRYNVNWNEKNIVLKFMSDTECPDIVVSSPFSTEMRGDCSFDMPMGEWISMCDGEKGVSFMADSLFSYTKSGSVLGLSVLRSCIYGDLRLCELECDADYPVMEQGICEGNLRICIHSGEFVKNKIMQMANSFNNPPIVICEANHNGPLQSVDSFVSVRAESIMMSALKESEDDSSEIIRLFEYAGKKQTVNINYFGRDFTIEMNPYEIKTVNVTEKGIKEVFITED